MDCQIMALEQPMVVMVMVIFSITISKLEKDSILNYFGIIAKLN